MRQQVIRYSQRPELWKDTATVTRESMGDRAPRRGDIGEADSD